MDSPCLLKRGALYTVVRCIAYHASMADNRQRVVCCYCQTNEFWVCANVQDANRIRWCCRYQGGDCRKGKYYCPSCFACYGSQWSRQTLRDNVSCWHALNEEPHPQAVESESMQPAVQQALRDDAPPPPPPTAQLLERIIELERQVHRTTNMFDELIFWLRSYYNDLPTQLRASTDWQ